MWDWVVSFATWFLDVLLWVPRELYKLLLDGLAAVIEAVPVGGIADALATGWGSLPSGLLWWLGVFEVDVGAGLVSAALLTRFVIRRLPFVG